MNMSIFLSLALCLLINFQVTQGQGDVTCQTSADCKPGQCCRSLVQPRGRRVAGLAFGHGGICKPSGTQDSLCIVYELETGTDGLFYDCPCDAGFVCVSTGQIVINKGTSGVCKLANSTMTVGQPCRSDADCADNECCRDDTETIGKRQFFDDAHAHCRKCP